MRNGRMRLITLAAGLAVLAVRPVAAQELDPAPAPVATPQDEAPASAPASADVAELVAWVRSSGDSAGLPFVVVDKVEAKVFVYDADGLLRGWAPALLGLARGDAAVPGIGQRPMSAIRPDERTTPAGRFVAAYGPARGAREVLWVDYGTAISLHPVVTSNPKEHRLARLQSADAEAHRITYGCINVPRRFYDEVVRPTFSKTEGIRTEASKGVVYVLPETTPLEDVFPGLRLRAQEARLGGAGGSSTPGALAAN